MLNFESPPTPTPNVNRWNIGRGGSPTQNSCVGHVHFIFLCRFLLPWVPFFSGIWAFSLYYTLRFVAWVGSENAKVFALRALQSCFSLP